MRREVMWSAWDDPGLGHLRLAIHNAGVVADGMVIGVTEGRPFRVAYEVRCDVGWRVRVRRLDLAPGESAEISVAYVEGTELQVWPEPQRYTCLEKGDRGGLYRFLSLDGGFTADLPVDADGLVLDYPGLFRRAFQTEDAPAY